MRSLNFNIMATLISIIWLKNIVTKEEFGGEAEDDEEGGWFKGGNSEEMKCLRGESSMTNCPGKKAPSILLMTLWYLKMTSLFECVSSPPKFIHIFIVPLTWLTSSTRHVGNQFFRIIWMFNDTFFLPFRILDNRFAYIYF